MIDPKVVNDTKVIFGPCRLSYTHVFREVQPDGDGEGKFMTNVLIPKSEKKTIEAIKKAIEAAEKAAIVAKWGGKEPKKLDLALRDGDEKDDEVYRRPLLFERQEQHTPGRSRSQESAYRGRGRSLQRRLGDCVGNFLRLRRKR